MSSIGGTTSSIASRATARRSARPGERRDAAEGGQVDHGPHHRLGVRAGITWSMRTISERRWLGSRRVLTASPHESPDFAHNGTNGHVNVPAREGAEGTDW